MADGFIVRKGGVTTEQALAPTITEVSTTDSSITFTIKNNDTASATIAFRVSSVTASGQTLTLAADTTSSNLTVSGLDDDTTFTVYATANVTGKVKSNVTELEISTDLVPVLLFDGTDDYVTFGTNAASSFTVEFQINLVTYNNTANTSLIAPVAYGGTGRWVIQIEGDLNTNRINMFADSFSTRSMTSSIVATDMVGVWSSLAVSYNGSQVKFYLDGVLKTTFNSSGSKQNSGTLGLMGQPNLPFSNVLLRDFRLWNIARTDQQIADNYDINLTGLESNLVVYYKVNEGTGTTLTDLANSFDGTIIGATWTTL